MKDPDKDKMTKAILKTAYLYCFTNWGYEFVFSKAGELIRNVLNGEANYPVPVPYIWLDEVSTTVYQQLPKGLVYMHNKTEAYGMFVYIPLMSRVNGYNCIAPIQIPSPTDNGIEEMESFYKLFMEKSAVDVMVTPIINTLDSLIAYPYSLSWFKIHSDLKSGKFRG